MDRSHALALLASILFAGCARTPPAEKLGESPAFFKVNPETAGSVSGKVTFTGKRPALGKIGMDQDPECARSHGAGVLDDSFLAGRDGGIANVFVYVKKGLDGKKFPAPDQPVTIDQKGCWFRPRVVGIQTGQTLRVTNSDPVSHNIHPLAQVNREWNHNQPSGAPAIERRFSRPEVMMRVKCNIHTWMRAWIGVVDHPYFRITGTDGTFELASLPPGDYTIEAWHEIAGRLEQNVMIAPAGKSTVEFVFKLE